MSAEPPKILCVDDDRTILNLYEAMLTPQGYELVLADNGRDAMLAMADHPVDLVLLDLMMPGLNGFEICRRMKEDYNLQHIPVAIVTTLGDRESRIAGLKVGANDWLTKPFKRKALLSRIKNLLKLKEFEDFLRDRDPPWSATLREKRPALREANVETAYRLALAAEYKEESTFSHFRRISHFTRRMAELLGFTDAEAEVMFHASPMHDVGKINVPESILLKPERLDFPEFETIKTHPLSGGEILKGTHSGILISARNFALYHHERWDGRGYPFGLEGEEIPIEGRILNLLDQYDALRSKRPHKSAMSHEDAVNILVHGDERTRPSHFDPQILETFVENHQDFALIYEANAV
jgi:putative two-component system response regulator